MPITVTSGGPSIPSTTPTLASLIALIADEIDDTTGEYTAQIQNSILGAIRYCEREVYYFNETRDLTFSTVQDQEWYDGNDEESIPTLMRIVQLYSEDSQGQRTTLQRMTPEEIETLADNSAASGEPYGWTYFGQRIRLYPIPPATVYTIRVQTGPYRLGTLVNTADTNAWLSEALDLVKARAKYVLGKDILKDPAMAAEALNDFNDQRMALKRETSMRNGSGVIRATTF